MNDNNEPSCAHSGGARQWTQRRGFPGNIMRVMRPRTGTFSCYSSQSQHQSHGNKSPSPKKQREPSTYPRHAEQILSILRDSRNLTQENITVMKNLLDQCSPADPVLRYLDNKGCDIVQRTALQGCTEFMEYILLKGFDLGLQERPCSSPLHLACKNGNAAMVRLLLQNNADIHHKSRACAHLHATYSYAQQQKLNNQITHRQFTCSDMVNKLTAHTPVQIAINHDRLPVLQVLLQHDKSRGCKLKTSSLLLDACKYGAEKCLRYIVEHFPEQVHQRDAAGRSMLTVAFQKSEACGRILLEHGRGWSEEQWTNASGGRTGESLLHVILRAEIEHPHDIVQLVFRAGYRDSYLALRDGSGATAMHMLMRQVGKRANLSAAADGPGDLFKHPTEDLSRLRERLQDDRDEQVFRCIVALHRRGADLQAVNAAGESLLHLLICDNYYRRLHGMRAGYYNSVLPQLNRVMEYLLGHGVSVNTASRQVSTPLTWAVHVLCSMESYEVESVWPGVVYCFSLLLKHGADPNIPDEKGISIITLILTAVNRWVSQCDSDAPRALATLAHMADLFTLFFQHGLDPPEDVIDLCTKQVAILCNINGSDGSFLSGVRDVLVPFFRVGGIDPNALRMVTETEDNYDVPCKLHAQFYLARSFIIHRRDENMFHFFSVFEHTLSRPQYNSLLTAVCSILTKNFHDNSSYETTRCIKRLQQQRQTVRTLKALTRITIAISLQWKITERVPALPLPKLLKMFLQDF